MTEENERMDPSALNTLFGNQAIEPAQCGHRCDCICHRPHETAVHCMPCCTGCGKGHSRILKHQLAAHLEKCHGVTTP